MHNGILTRYIYDGNNLIVEQRCAKRLTYFYCVDGVAGFIGNTYQYRKNVQGDVTHIYKQEQDNSLTQVAHYSYDAWGNTRILQDKDGIATLNPFRYRSYYFDEETGLYYLQSRYYDPELGRFISADSIEYLDPETLGGLNLYAYCGNNPVMNFDPTGEFFLTCLLVGLIAGAIIGATIGGVVAYNNAVESGATGWKPFGQTVLGVFTGAVIGGAIGSVIGAGIGIGAVLGAGATMVAGIGTMVVGGGIAISSVALGAYVFWGKKSKLSGKETASDRPSWVNGDMIDPNLTPQQNATNILNNKYGQGNWKTGPKTEYNTIKKWMRDG